MGLMNKGAVNYFDGSFCFTACCDIDSKTGECAVDETKYSDTNNYITVTYGHYNYYYYFTEPVITTEESKVSHLRIGETLIGPSSEFEVENGTKVDIFFSDGVSDIALLENQKDIISVDFSNFDSSQTTHITALFSGCTSLKSVDLTSFKSLQISGLNRPIQSLKTQIWYTYQKEILRTDK